MPAILLQRPNSTLTHNSWLTVHTVLLSDESFSASEKSAQRDYALYTDPCRNLEGRSDFFSAVSPDKPHWHESRPQNYRNHILCQPTQNQVQILPRADVPDRIPRTDLPSTTNEPDSLRHPLLHVFWYSSPLVTCLRLRPPVLFLSRPMLVNPNDATIHHQVL